MKYLIYTILLYPAYLIFVFMIDMRVEVLRPDIQKNAIEVGSEYAVMRWKEEHKKNESYYERKRIARDEMVKEYIKHLERLMDE